VRYQNLPRASEEYDDPDHDYVSTSEWASGSGSDTETEPNSLPVDIEGLSDIDSIAHTRTHHIHQWEEGHHSPILGYLDAALSFIASERGWYAVQRDRDMGRGWGRIGRRSRWRRGDGKMVKGYAYGDYHGRRRGGLPVLPSRASHQGCANRERITSFENVGICADAEVTRCPSLKVARTSSYPV
jgi:hypothetical protein